MLRATIGRRRRSPVDGPVRGAIDRAAGRRGYLGGRQHGAARCEATCGTDGERDLGGGGGGPRGPAALVAIE